MDSGGHMGHELGGVIVSGLLRTVAWLAVFCVLAFDTGGIVTNRVLLDEAARVAARHAAEAMAEPAARRARPATALAQGRAAAEASLADQPGVMLTDLRMEDGRVVLEARRQARVVVAGALPPLKDHVNARTVVTAELPR